LVGFCAQAVDGTLGMGYGLLAASSLLMFGLAPATASASVHMAEVITTGVSAVSHHLFGNVQPELFRRLVIPGIIGAIIGAYLLVWISGDVLKPWIAGYMFVMGVVVLRHAFSNSIAKPAGFGTAIGLLGFIGAMLDAIGGGGWGPIVVSTLVARGNSTRNTIGTANAVEFFITIASSVVFLLTLRAGLWPFVIPLSVGGFMAAPIGAWLCKRLAHRRLTGIVGAVILLNAAVALIKWFTRPS